MPVSFVEINKYKLSLPLLKLYYNYYSSFSYDVINNRAYIRLGAALENSSMGWP